MATPPPKIRYQGTIDPLVCGRPQSSDLIDHTLRHFVKEVAASFEHQIEIAGVMNSVEARHLLMELGRTPAELRQLPERHERLVDASWWNRAFGPTLQRIHDEGYAPRYKAGVQSCPEPGRGSPWIFMRRSEDEQYDRYAVELEWTHVLLAVDLLERSDAAAGRPGRVAIRTAHFHYHPLTSRRDPAADRLAEEVRRLLKG